uniref:Cytochrome c oxidase subunit 7A2, mitochondrial n=1 Tax=Sciurus vulgaris TaxID=55149 RepID=A0A8D2CQ03_SCIVU
MIKNCCLENNGIPVHLKSWAADALLYGDTMILTVGGTAYATPQLSIASSPKWQDGPESSQQSFGSVSFSS